MWLVTSCVVGWSPGGRLCGTGSGKGSPDVGGRPGGEAWQEGVDWADGGLPRFRPLIGRRGEAIRTATTTGGRYSYMNRAILNLCRWSEKPRKDYSVSGGANQRIQGGPESGSPHRQVAGVAA